jgi:excisionase family DNA binding protein
MSDDLAFLLPPGFIDRVAERVAEILRSEFAPASEPLADYLNVDEAANYLRAKPHRVYDLVSSGRLSRFKDGSRLLVKRTELDQYLAGALPSRCPTLLTRSRRRIRIVFHRRAT